MLGHGSVLRLHLSEAAQGGYTCEAAVPGFPKLATSYQVSLRGPPEIEAAAEQKLAEVGASTTVSCEVRNQGPASWSRGAAWLARVAAAVARVSMVPLSRSGLRPAARTSRRHWCYRSRPAPAHTARHHRGKYLLFARYTE